MMGKGRAAGSPRGRFRKGNMSIIYEPKGAALEYSPLACNLWTTCSHGCKYCYAPGVLQKKKEEFFVEAPERKDVLQKLEKDCQKMQGDPRPILLSFVSDPYQPHDYEAGVTRKALEILERYHMTAQVLTKGGTRAVRDFDILRRNGYGWKFGTSLNCYGLTAMQWEPHAATYPDRYEAICRAHLDGIYTWVSVEPVIDPERALHIIESLLKFVDFWKIGKLNHHAEQEKRVDWGKFLKDVRLLLKDRPHYIKNDLLGWDDVSR
jgi:DNA repair photolyase